MDGRRRYGDPSFDVGVRHLYCLVSGSCARSLRSWTAVDPALDNDTGAFLLGDTHRISEISLARREPPQPRAKHLGAEMHVTSSVGGLRADRSSVLSCSERLLRVVQSLTCGADSSGSAVRYSCLRVSIDDRGRATHGIQSARNLTPLNCDASPLSPS